MYSTFYASELKIWKGPNILPLYNPKISLAQVLLSALTTYGPKVAQVYQIYIILIEKYSSVFSSFPLKISDDGGIRLTFDEIRIQTIRAARNLQKCGYQPKQVLGFLGKNSRYLAPIIFASISIISFCIYRFRGELK